MAYAKRLVVSQFKNNHAYTSEGSKQDSEFKPACKESKQGSQFKNNHAYTSEESKQDSQFKNNHAYTSEESKQDSQFKPASTNE